MFKLINNTVHSYFQKKNNSVHFETIFFTFEILKILFWWFKCFPNERKYGKYKTVQFSSFSHVQLFAIPHWLAACKASLFITNSWSLLKLMSIKLVMQSNHLLLCHPLLLLPSIFPSIRVFSNELILCIRWPKYWSFSYSISPSNDYSGLISFKID